MHRRRSNRWFGAWCAPATQLWCGHCFVRGLTYREYEWAEAAGRDQVAALVVKHVVLVALVLAGCVFLYRLQRLGRDTEGGAASA
jgi:hypothetical protein